MQEKETPKRKSSSSRAKKTTATTTTRASKALPERELPQAPAQQTINAQSEQIANETF